MIKDKKITAQTYTRKCEILDFSDNLIEIAMIPESCMLKKTSEGKTALFNQFYCENSKILSV